MKLKVVMAVGLCLTAIWLLRAATRPVQGEAGGWSEPLNLSNSTVAAFDVHMVEANGALVAIWLQINTPISDNNVVWFAERPAGLGWTTPVKVVDLMSLTVAKARLQASADGTLHLALETKDGSGPTPVSQVYHAYRPPAGAWTTPEQQSTLGSDGRLDEIVVDSSGKTHLAWEEQSGGTTTVHYSSRPGGGAWSAPFTLDTIEGFGAQTDLAVGADGHVHAIWVQVAATDPALVYNDLPPAGSWSAPTVVDSGIVGSLQLAENGGDVYAAWVETGGGETVTFAEKSAGGSWSLPQSLSAAMYLVRFLRLDVDDDGGIYAAWAEQPTASDPRNAVWRERPAGTAWQAAQNLSHYGSPTGAVRAMRLEVAGDGTVHLTWVGQPDENSDLDTYTIGRVAAGAWGLVINVSQSGQAEPDLDMAAGAGTAYAAWIDNTAGDGDVFFAEGAPVEVVAQLFLPSILR